MSETTFSINSINPWRMMLFGSLGVLIPLSIFIAFLELISQDFKTENGTLLTVLFLFTLLLSGLSGYFGFKFSSNKIELKIDSHGWYEVRTPRLLFLPVKKTFYQWQQLLSHSLTEDSKGKILEIKLQNHQTITIGIAYVLNKPDHFDAFYAAFLQQLDQFRTHLTDAQREEIPYQKGPDFYKSKAGKIVAYGLLILMLGIIILLFISDKKLQGWEWWRFIFIELLAGLYIWRSLFKKPGG